MTKLIKCLKRICKEEKAGDLVEYVLLVLVLVLTLTPSTKFLSRNIRNVYNGAANVINPGHSNSCFFCGCN